MKKQILTITAGLACTAAGLMAQPTAQSAQGTGVGAARGGVILPFTTSQQAESLGTVVAVGGRGGVQNITGSPFSAREENKSVQTLGDGTRIETSVISQIYRDSQGRTRVERTDQGSTIITIVDPVGGFRMSLDPAAKSATRLMMAAGRGGVAVGGGGGGRGGAGAGAAAVGGTFTMGEGVNNSGMETFTIRSTEPATAAIRRTPAADPNVKHEDLGFQSMNGVMAEGHRTTRIIPAGSIGNNRDISIVNEQWFSKDLQRIVKSVNTDPRYGTTTDELTNISHDAPDAGLFMIPAGYTITEGGGRGRGVAMPVPTQQSQGGGGGGGR
jgi:hypothetical protein